MSGLGRVTVRRKGQKMIAVSSCSQAFTALHIIMSHVAVVVFCNTKGFSGNI